MAVVVGWYIYRRKNCTWRPFIFWIQVLLLLWFNVAFYFSNNHYGRDFFFLIHCINQFNFFSGYFIMFAIFIVMMMLIEWFILNVTSLFKFFSITFFFEKISIRIPFLERGSNWCFRNISLFYYIVALKRIVCWFDWMNELNKWFAHWPLEIIKIYIEK